MNLSFLILMKGCFTVVIYFSTLIEYILMLQRRNLPSLNALRAFEASGRKLSFRAAADELGVTQGAVAQQVRGLEEYLNVLLFERHPRGLRLTADGSAYLIEINHAFDIITESTKSLLSQPNCVTISVPPTIAAKLLIPNLGELHTAFPDIKLNILATESVLDFDTDRVDIAIRLTEQQFNANLETQLLFRQEIVAVASPHLIKQLTLPLNNEQLLQMPLLHDSHGHWPRFLETNIKLSGPVLNQTTLALDLALSGQGIALACKAFVNTDIQSGRLLQVSNKIMIIEPSYYLIKKKTTHYKNEINKIWCWCIKNLGLSNG